MLYFAVGVVLILSFIVILFIKDTMKYLAYLFPVLFFFLTSLFLFVMYVAKDANFYSQFLVYFPFPKETFNYFALSSVSKETVIRLLNYSCIGFIYANIWFIQQYTKVKPRVWVHILILFSLILQLIVYDPRLYIYIYRFLYPDYLSSQGILAAGRLFSQFTIVLNTTYMIACVVQLLVYCVKSPKVRYIRYHLLSMTICYAMLIGTYLFLFSRVPTILVKYSRVADLVTFQSMTLHPTPTPYIVLPIVLTLLFFSCLLTVYRYNSILAKMRSNNLIISQNIDTATVTTRIFSHYIKNEMLSLMARIEEVPQDEKNREHLQQLQQHCEEIYDRINEIHLNTRDGIMHKVNVNLSDIIDSAVDHLSYAAKSGNIDIEIHIPDDTPMVLVDVDLFKQAIINILTNAIESMKKKPNPAHRLSIHVHHSNKWIFITIKDTGIGINQKELLKIFTPLFSTKSIARNWGIGLSLAYKVISQCDGKISVSSKEGEGAAFEIMLPNTQNLGMGKVDI